MDKCSHGGTRMSEAVGHLNRMSAEHGKAAAAGMKPVGGAKQPVKAIQAMGKAGRRGA